MKYYWVSCLILNKRMERVEVVAFSDSCVSIEEAMDGIERLRQTEQVLSAWVDSFDKDNVKTVEFHKCYVEGLGVSYV